LIGMKQGRRMMVVLDWKLGLRTAAE
jgi:hypothetical protein